MHNPNLTEQLANYADHLNNIITANDTQIYCYDPVFKQQMSKWVPSGSSHLLKWYGTKLKMKCMDTTFNWEHLIKHTHTHTHTVPDGQTVNVD